MKPRTVSLQDFSFALRLRKAGFSNPLNWMIDRMRIYINWSGRNIPLNHLT